VILGGGLCDDDIELVGVFKLVFGDISSCGGIWVLLVEIAGIG
jgi:hypothetical protein